MLDDESCMFYTEKCEYSRNSNTDFQTTTNNERFDEIELNDLTRNFRVFGIAYLKTKTEKNYFSLEQK